MVAEGRKTIETRTWATKHRGDLVIVSTLDESFYDSGILEKFPPALGEIYQTGCAIAVVELVDIRPMEKKDEDAACMKVYPRAKSWMLRNIRSIPAVEIKGKMGVYSLSAAEAEHITRLLRGGSDGA